MEAKNEQMKELLDSVTDKHIGGLLFSAQIKNGTSFRALLQLAIFDYYKQQFGIDSEKLLILEIKKAEHRKPYYCFECGNIGGLHVSGCSKKEIIPKTGSELRDAFEMETGNRAMTQDMKSLYIPNYLIWLESRILQS